MPVMAIYRSRDITADQYERYRREAPLKAAPAKALSHTYAQTAKGFVSVDVWQDRQALEAWIEKVGRPAANRAGLEFVEPEVFDVTTFMVTPGVRKFELAYESVPA